MTELSTVLFHKFYGHSHDLIYKILNRSNAVWSVSYHLIIYFLLETANEPSTQISNRRQFHRVDEETLNHLSTYSLVRAHGFSRDKEFAEIKEVFAKDGRLELVTGANPRPARILRYKRSNSTDTTKCKITWFSQCT